MALRHDFVETVAQHYDTRRFHFLDETGLRLDASRRYAHAVGGQWVGQAVPLKRGGSLTLIGLLSCQTLEAVQLFEGALNYQRFALYVGYCLAPVLRRGDVLVLDNLPVHKIGGLREWLAERGVQVLFLPPYSPDFAPIEQAWSKLKTALRTAQAPSRQALQEAVQAAVDWITSADAQHWFNHCGYHVQIA
ncbi:IS630 family transposase [Hymenobacter elongatus]|uniref:IS630 family transposase n=1 Tax=Hymenobacter elongatus TaxID=877208 RepID=UPI001FD877F5|nr:IS630 family transposase [Hymenobacter elongatus]